MEKIALKPSWLKVRAPGGENYLRIKSLLKNLKLHTVCEEAHCPNVAECWGEGTATIMLLGNVCTRGCRFCNVKTGHPNGWVDNDEPLNVAEAIANLGLKYVVLTSVNRDDLKDGGAKHFSKTVHEIKKRDRSILVEILIPDFLGDIEAIKIVAMSGADVVAHNMETVERLTPSVRDVRANYKQSLNVLKYVTQVNPSVYSKTSLMLGLGEKKNEVINTMENVLDSGVSVLTLGQYLRPSMWHLPVERYLTPQEFEEYELIGRQMGFKYVVGGPLVRSSYKAGEVFISGLVNNELEEIRVSECRGE